MRPFSMEAVERFVEENIGDFHRKRLESLQRQNLTRLLKRKNPYLFRAKNVATAREYIVSILDAHLSSSEEGILGDWLEGLAIFVNKEVYGGWKSGMEGVDLEFEKGRQRYIVSIKSGPNWGNSSQISRLIDNFNRARRVLKTSNASVSIVAVNGCCYGRHRQNSEYRERGDYYKLCGQRFWELISGDADLYAELVELLGHGAVTQNRLFYKEYESVVDQFTQGFSEVYCTDGNIDWRALAHLNSGA